MKSTTQTHPSPNRVKEEKNLITYEVKPEAGTSAGHVETGGGGGGATETVDRVPVLLFSAVCLQSVAPSCFMGAFVKWAP